MGRGFGRKWRKRYSTPEEFRAWEEEQRVKLREKNRALQAAFRRRHVEILRTQRRIGVLLRRIAREQQREWTSETRITDAAHEIANALTTVLTAAAHKAVMARLTDLLPTVVERERIAQEEAAARKAAIDAEWAEWDKAHPLDNEGSDEEADDE